MKVHGEYISLMWYLTKNNKMAFKGKMAGVWTVYLCKGRKKGRKKESFRDN